MGDDELALDDDWTFVLSIFEGGCAFHLNLLLRKNEALDEQGDPKLNAQIFISKRRGALSIWGLPCPLHASKVMQVMTWDT